VQLVAGGLLGARDGGDRDAEHPVRAPGEGRRAGQPGRGVGLGHGEQAAAAGSEDGSCAQHAVVELGVVAGQVPA
jgi:hypothetical protein